MCVREREGWGGGESCTQTPREKKIQTKNFTEIETKVTVSGNILFYAYNNCHVINGLAIPSNYKPF